MYFFVITCLFVLALLAIGTPAAWLLLTRKSRQMPFALILILLFFIGIILSGVNWIVGQVIVFDGLLGGDAVRGKIVDDHYFLGRGSGEYTEVSRELYWFSYWYLRASQLTVAICWGGLFGTFFVAKRRRRRQWLHRVRTLAERNDLEALNELIDLIDDPIPFSGRKAPEDLRKLFDAIRAKTNKIAVPTSPALSPDATPEERTKQKETWQDWVKTHEGDLSEHFERRADGGISSENPQKSSGSEVEQ